MADILTRIDKNTEGAIMAKLTERDQALAESIRALMFVFDDLVDLDSRGMQELMKEISKEDLPIALRGATPEIKEKFLKNMSSRAAEMLREDLEAKGPVKLSEVEREQKEILGIVRRLESSGESEIPSTQIGEMVMDALRGLDPVAYVRFASVYRNFGEASDFRAVLGEIGSEDGTTATNDTADAD